MQVFTFQSTKDADVFGFTADRTGGNLPSDFGPWQARGGQAIPSGASLVGIGSSDAVLAGIAKDGFFLARSGEVTVTIMGHP